MAACRPQWSITIGSRWSTSPMVTRKCLERRRRRNNFHWEQCRAESWRCWLSLILDLAIGELQLQHSGFEAALRTLAELACSLRHDNVHLRFTGTLLGLSSGTIDPVRFS
ncbi:hypothetical protein M440DRAFT_265433 [Trichoderma longibrachiatum ATCC 18648]|uniref:Uncharacterized protein n=1 Tax=Trichoderma longibrachiatum ATCC 18648 TaxID=983965 RepID=A0A2T4CAK2_TRILO|nr:hypothetical protein M440DRAFT_265433 [Trichoderma longibrachiatum ATCC 18648]